MTRVLLIGLLVTLSGCEDTSLPRVEPWEEVQLGPLLPADAVLVGVAETHDARLFVLDQRSGLYEIAGSSASLFFNTTGLSGVELTDVVALDNQRLALTAENDGFLLDLTTQELTSYFCYLPGGPPIPPAGVGGSPPVVAAPSTGGAPSIEPVVSVSQTLQLEGVAVKQRTESVAYNFGTQQLFAQPQTIRLDTGSVAGSELFTFADGGGEPIRVQPFADASFVAGGMVSPGDNRLLMGTGRQLYEGTWSGEPRPLRELDRGIEISGMAPARAFISGGSGAGQLGVGAFWVLDGAGRRLLKHHLSNL